MVITTQSTIKLLLSVRIKMTYENTLPLPLQGKENGKKSILWGWTCIIISFNFP